MTLCLLAGSLACGRSDEDVVARIGKSTITQEQFRRKLSEVSPDYQNYVVTPYGRRQFLEVLIREKLILEAARADGVPSAPAFRERMRQLKREEEEKLREASDYLMARLWLDKLREKGVIRVTEEEKKDFLRKHPKEVSARHILLATAEKAEQVLKRVRRGASFARLAKRESLDADTAVNGGQMPPSLAGEFIPELEVLFKMRVGEVGGPVRSKFGYHVLLKEKERAMPYAAVKDRIGIIIEKQKLDDHLKSLQASYRVEVIDAQFK